MRVIFAAQTARKLVVLRFFSGFKMCLSEETRLVLLNDGQKASIGHFDRLSDFYLNGQRGGLSGE